MEIEIENELEIEIEMQIEIGGASYEVRGRRWS